MNKLTQIDPIGDSKQLEIQVSSDNLKNILSELPDAVKVGLNFHNGIARWSITQKPEGFSVEEERSLIERLSEASLKINFD